MLMGMFSTIYCNYMPLGPEFQCELQTKDLENAMDHYWLSPDGKFYMLEYEVQGSRGELCPYLKSGFLRVYPARKMKEWIEAHLYIESGQIKQILFIGQPNEEPFAC